MTNEFDFTINNFDWIFYTSYYNDLKIFKTRDQALNHYIKFGFKEKRYINKEKELLKEIKREYELNYLKFLKYFNKKKNICIVGKGELSKNISTNYDVYVATKNTCCILPRCDILQLNDFEGIFGNEKYLKDLKFILFPITIHVELVSNLEFNYEKFIKYCRYYDFKGDFIIYNIDKGPDNDFIEKNKELDERYKLKFPKIICKSSADVVCHLLNKLEFNKDLTFNLYGIGTSEKCNKDIEHNFESSIVKNEYNFMKTKYSQKKYKDDKIDEHYKKRLGKFKGGFRKISKSFKFIFN